jgi:drug/metabolite transporter (DMT)-like permease
MLGEFKTISFALGAAITWGSGDFCGGLAARRTNAFAVIIASNIVGILLLTLLARLWHESIFTLPNLLWGGIAGLAGGIGLLSLYTALASGQMSIAASLSAVISVILPVLFAAWSEGAPAMLQWLGFALAALGIGLVSSTGDVTKRIALAALTLPMLAGLGFGCFFIIIDHAGDYGVFAPLVFARLIGGMLALVLALARRQALLPPPSLWPLASLAGVLDSLANCLFVLAAQTGRLDIASTLSSLYPAVTILWAWLLLREHLNSRQQAGVVAVLAAIILIVL